MTFIFSGVKVWGLKGGKEIADMKVNSRERGGDNTQYPVVLLCVMQLIFQVFYLFFGLRGSEAKEDLMYVLLLHKGSDVSMLCWVKEQLKSE